VEANDDPEKRIQELERSLNDVAASSELTGAPPTRRTTPGLRWSMIVLLVAVIGLGSLAVGVAIFVAQRPGRSSSTGVTSSRPSVASPTTRRSVASPTSSIPANPSVQRLYQVVPPPYNAQNCKPIESPNRQALATVECKKLSDPSSPSYAAFSLYPSADALDKAFQDGVSEDAVTPCPDGLASPGVWQSPDGPPNVEAGAVLCGAYDNHPDLVWTQKKDLMLADFQGPDLNALFKFWQSL
jgi:serine/threonine kinase PknH